MPNATFTWRIPADAAPQTATTSSGSTLPLTPDWSLYVGPVRRGTTEVAIAPPDLDFDDEAWPTYPHAVLVAGGDPLDCTTLVGPPAQPADGRIWLDSIS